MTTDKLYSKKVLLGKAVYAVLLPVLTEFIAMLFDVQNALIYIFIAVFFLGLAYAVPFMLTLKALQREKTDTVRMFVWSDFAYLLFPIIISTVISDSVFTVFNGDTKGLGFFSIVVIGVTVIITLVFWCLYLLFNRK